MEFKVTNKGENIDVFIIHNQWTVKISISNHIVDLINSHREKKKPLSSFSYREDDFYMRYANNRIILVNNEMQIYIDSTAVFYINMLSEIIGVVWFLGPDCVHTDSYNITVYSTFAEIKYPDILVKLNVNNRKTTVRMENKLMIGSESAGYRFGFVGKFCSDLGKKDVDPLLRLLKKKKIKVVEETPQLIQYEKVEEPEEIFTDTSQQEKIDEGYAPNTLCFDRKNIDTAEILADHIDTLQREKLDEEYELDILRSDRKNISDEVTVLVTEKAKLAKDIETMRLDKKDLEYDISTLGMHRARLTKNIKNHLASLNVMEKERLDGISQMEKINDEITALETVKKTLMENMYTLQREKNTNINRLLLHEKSLRDNISTLMALNTKEEERKKNLESSVTKLTEEIESVKRIYDDICIPDLRMEDIKGNNTYAMIGGAYTEIKIERKEYVYIVHIREFASQNIPIYKIGRTKRNNPFDRIREYGVGSVLKMIISCDDCVLMENEIKKVFKKKFTHRRDLGRNANVELFEGDITEMMEQFVKINFDISKREKEVEFTEEVYNDEFDGSLDW